MIKKKKIKIIKNKKGNIIKFFNFQKDTSKKKYGEIYFSEVKKKYFKGWKFHEKRNQIMTICSGSIEVSFKNKNSSRIKKIKLSYPKNLYALQIPKKTYYSFRCLSRQKAIIVNIIDEVVK